MEGYETDALTLGEEWERLYAAISDERDEVEEVMLYRHLYMAGASAALQLMGRTANATVREAGKPLAEELVAFYAAAEKERRIREGLK